MCHPMRVPPGAVKGREWVAPSSPQEEGSPADTSVLAGEDGAAGLPNLQNYKIINFCCNSD